MNLTIAEKILNTFAAEARKTAWYAPTSLGSAQVIRFHFEFAPILDLEKIAALFSKTEPFSYQVDEGDGILIKGTIDGMRIEAVFLTIPNEYPTPVYAQMACVATEQ
jgi:hypothetical protein